MGQLLFCEYGDAVCLGMYTHAATLEIRGYNEITLSVRPQLLDHGC